MLDEVLLEPAGDLLVGERGDGDHSPELALEPLVKPVKLLVASGYLEMERIKVLLFIAESCETQTNLNVAKVRSDWVCHESFQSSKFASFLGSPHLASVRTLAVLPDEEILNVFDDVRLITCPHFHHFA